MQCLRKADAGRVETEFDYTHVFLLYFATVLLLQTNFKTQHLIDLIL